ncbi:hypothetical protein QYE76_014919 [Lolium multiflorum]|uniref:Aspartic peptidase DDI1-type domain-containing protein n=1 Tax=Lolium multiflorum TaxID=4521 RepID=A0AAD8X8M7_LOLMU|nr:hypothetical protein QYE76_014919 [Lolium multiflorum]
MKISPEQKRYDELKAILEADLIGAFEKTRSHTGSSSKGSNPKPISKMLVDTGAAVNIMPYSMLRRLGRSNEDLIKTNVTLSDFNGQPSEAKGVLNVDLNVGRKTIPSSFFIVDSKSTYAGHCCLVIAPPPLSALAGSLAAAAARGPSLSSPSSSAAADVEIAEVARPRAEALAGGSSEEVSSSPLLLPSPPRGGEIAPGEAIVVASSDSPSRGMEALPSVEDLSSSDQTEKSSRLIPVGYGAADVGRGPPRVPLGVGSGGERIGRKGSTKKRRKKRKTWWQRRAFGVLMRRGRRRELQEVAK